MDYGQIVLELLVTFFVVGAQFSYFHGTRKKIQEFKNSFPEGTLNESNIAYYKKIPSGEIVELIKIDRNTYSVEFGEIVDTINKYLERNKGAIDFALIKNIVDRSVESQEEDATSNISLPLYIGLMGTFLGIIIGLLKIAFFGGVIEENISSFLGGVFIAMIASLLGLFFTVINNSVNFRSAKKNNDKRRDAFFSFLQIHLFPHYGNSIYDIFERFKNNINDFNSKFGKNIEIFDDNFSKNVTDLKESVSSLSLNITPVIENIKTQREFLLELKKIGYQRMAEANLKVFKVMNEAGPHFVNFIEKQKELNNTIDKTILIVTKIDSLLNRISTFESNINALGDRIDNADYMGSDLLNKVNKQLSVLDEQFELLKQHSQYSKGQIEEHYKKEIKDIETLSDRILNELQFAMNFNVESNPLHKLKLLENVHQQLAEINARINNPTELNQIVMELSNTKSLIGDINEKASSMKLSITLLDNEIENSKTNSEKSITKRSFWRQINPFRRKKG